MQHHDAIMTNNAEEVQLLASAREQMLNALVSQVQQLTQALTKASPAPPSAPSPPASAVSGPMLGPRVGIPERYAGDPENCNPFNTNCSILYALQPYAFASEAAKVTFTTSHLTGRAQLWGTAEWEIIHPTSSSS